MIIPRRITHRVYYWVEDAPYARQGGPWWWRDFGHVLEASAMVDAIRGVCKSIFYVTDKDIPLPEHTAEDIQPPANAINVLEDFDVVQLANAAG